MFIISILLLMAVVSFTDPAAVLDAISKSDLNCLLVAFAGANLALLIRVLKWKVLLNDISFMNLMPVQIFGLSLSNLTPGKAAEPIKSFALKLWKNTPVSSTLPTVIWERVMDIIILIIFGCVGVYLVVHQYFFLGIVSIIIFTAFIFSMIFILYNKPFGFRVFNALKKLPVLNKINEQFLKTFYESRIPGRKLMLCLIITLLAWLLDGLTFYLVLLSFSVNLPVSAIFLMSCVLSLSILIGLLSTLPGGIGGTEVVMVVLLMSMGVEQVIAVSTVILGRFITLGYSMILGYASFLYLSKKIDIKNIMEKIWI
ncbi:MAG: flippase-like domain-containing protein [Candidatus Aenigmarchaeota archaeon]|nr:flippase-like domain-containing protein [Candidatus Aenigmarchaeota archaeon]